MGKKTDVEQQLWRYGELFRRIGECERELHDEYGKKNDFLSAQLRERPMDGVRSKGGETPDPVFHAVRVVTEVYDERILYAKNRLSALIAEQERIRWCIDTAGLDETERAYIMHRYVKGLTVTAMVGKMMYSESRLRQVRASLLKKLAAGLQEGNLAYGAR